MREPLRSRAKLKGEMKVKAEPRVPPREDVVSVESRAAALPGRLCSHCETRRAQSVHVGTREMMNYTWSG